MTAVAGVLLAEPAIPSTTPTTHQTAVTPPLESGDLLAHAEFERRYSAMPNLKKAELIEGIVYMPSPVRHKGHSRPHAHVMAWLTNYYVATPGVDLGDNATVRLDADNEPQPDALLRIEREAGGTSVIGAYDYIEGPPELIIEIAGSSASYDLHVKLDVYRRNGVQEYVVWRVYDREIDWFYLDQGQYRRLLADVAGIVRSRVFPGLWLAVPALLNGNLAGALVTLQQGLQSEEHTAFVAQLAARLAG